jgi:hypothetical protein
MIPRREFFNLAAVVPALPDGLAVLGVTQVPSFGVYLDDGRGDRSPTAG